MNKSLIIIIISSVLVNNFVLVRFLGLCPFIGLTGKIATAGGMGAALVFVVTIASAVCWMVDSYLLQRLGLGFLRTVAFILVIAALVQLLEMAIRKSTPATHKSLGVYLPLITTNCAVLGAAILNFQQGFSFIESVVNGAAIAGGWMLAAVLFAGIREKLELSDIPKPLRGAAIAFITAGLLSMAFMGFSGFIR